MLFRLDKFKISLNRGEKVYTCYNFNYLANQKLNQTTETIPNQFFNDIEKEMNKNNIPFHISYIINKNSFSNKNIANKLNCNKFTYKDIFNNIVNYKYFPLQSFNLTLDEKKDRRTWKALNLFCYLALTQTLLLNLCTFVFFNWDIMEPITTCISFMNIICGYYFWAYSNGVDYEISSIADWMKSRSIFYKTVHKSLQEKEELVEFLNKKKEE
jgi:hypothetical protein